MRRSAIAALALSLAAGIAPPAVAHTRVILGFSWWGGWPFYAAPPAVVYAPPPVVYAAPPVVYAPPPAPTVDAVPTSPIYRDGYGRTCREFRSMAIIGGRAEPIYGTACLQPDGSWRIVG